MRPSLALLRLLRVLLVHRLDEPFRPHLPLPLRVLLRLWPRGRRELAGKPLAERVRLALEAAGPIFVKAGQILSTRRDLLSPEFAEALARLRDQVRPFPGEIAAREVERALGRPLADCFLRFEREPLASASIAQVHAATLPSGEAVVVKVLRPGVETEIARDLGLLRWLAEIVARHHPRAERIRPLEIWREIAVTLENELDLSREGANASALRRHFESSPDLYVPKVHWELSGERVLTLERVYGIPVDDIAALDAAGIDRKKLAAKGVKLFYTQVFRDNFFHADAHPGNIWVDPRSGREPRFIALDFGIMGSLAEIDRYYLAENFLALFRRDWKRIAALHLEAGWIPPKVREDELEAAVRAVCEPYFTRPLAQISVAEVVAKLFRTAQRFELVLQPQLILLQKTLLNIEGLGRLLDPEIDIWGVAGPVLEDILRERHRIAFTLRELGLPQRLWGFPRQLAEAGELIARIRAGELTVRLAAEDRELLSARRPSGSGALLGFLAGALAAGTALAPPAAPAAWLALGLAFLLLVFAWRRS
jgi:ubiquinone biosynthesis protein